MLFLLFSASVHGGWCRAASKELAQTSYFMATNRCPLCVLVHHFLMFDWDACGRCVWDGFVCVCGWMQKFTIEQCMPSVSWSSEFRRFSSVCSAILSQTTCFVSVAIGAQSNQCVWCFSQSSSDYDVPAVQANCCCLCVHLPCMQMVKLPGELLQSSFLVGSFICMNELFFYVFV